MSAGVLRASALQQKSRPVRSWRPQVSFPGQPTAVITLEQKKKLVAVVVVVDGLWVGGGLWVWWVVVFVVGVVVVVVVVQTLQLMRDLCQKPITECIELWRSMTSPGRVPVHTAPKSLPLPGVTGKDTMSEPHAA